MSKERVLITVKTYPTLSTSYVELACTAGFRQDGSWVRIYPVPFRLLGADHQFAKWTWVELPLVRRAKDHRPESFSPVDRNDITVGETIGTADGWRERREWVLGRGKVWTDLTALIAAGKRDEVSLATFRPARMIGFEWQKAEAEWDAAKLATAQQQLQQRNLLDAAGLREDFKPANKMPYDFYFKFADDKGRESRMRILDWEIGMLYWNCLKGAHGKEDEALEKVRHRYETDFFAKDLHLFLGTTYEWHKRAPNPWVVVGVFPPPVQKQLDLI
jgi:hypothetical protein